jgi:hypothetical protein
VRRTSSPNNDPYNWLTSSKQRIIMRSEKAILQTLCQHYAFNTAGIIGRSFQFDYLDPVAAKCKYLFSLNNPVVRPAHIKLCRCNIEQIPLAEQTIDFLVLPHIIEHVTHWAAWLKHISLCINSSGYLLFFQFSPYSVSRIQHKQNTYLSPFTLKQQLRKNNFSIVATQLYGLPFSKHFPPSTTEKMMGRFIPFNHLGYFVLAKKQHITATLIGNKQSRLKSKRPLISATNFRGNQ